MTQRRAAPALLGALVLCSLAGCAGPSPGDPGPSSYAWGDEEERPEFVPGSTKASDPAAQVVQASGFVKLEAGELPQRAKLPGRLALRYGAGPSKFSYVGQSWSEMSLFARFGHAIWGVDQDVTWVVDWPAVFANAHYAWGPLIEVVPHTSRSGGLPVLEVLVSRARGARSTSVSSLEAGPKVRTDTYFDLDLQLRLLSPTGELVGAVTGHAEENRHDPTNSLDSFNLVLSRAYLDATRKFFADSKIVAQLEAWGGGSVRPKPAPGTLGFPIEPRKTAGALVLLVPAPLLPSTPLSFDDRAEFERLQRLYLERKFPGAEIVSDPARVEGRPHLILSFGASSGVDQRQTYDDQTLAYVNTALATVSYVGAFEIKSSAGQRLAGHAVKSELQVMKGDAALLRAPFPELISRALVGYFRELDRALEEAFAGGASLRDPGPEAGGDGSPLVLLSKAAARTVLPTVKLSGRAQDDRGVAKLEVYRNGESLDLATLRGPGGVVRRVLPKAQPSLAFEFVIPLQPGKNTLRVVATDTGGQRSEDQWVVERVEDAGTLHAVVIGVGAYRNARKLPYARADAQAFAEYLTKDLKVPEGQVHLVLDEQATLRKLRTLLGKTLPAAAAQGDTVMIFFAGHGGLEPDPSAKDGVRSYLYPVGVEENDLYATALPMDELHRVFARIRAKRVVFVSDCCYSGAAAGGAFATRAGQTSFLKALGKGEGRVVLTACKPNEVARSSRDLGHGLFTHYLLEGLKSGAADVDRDGLIDTDEAFAYVSKRVAKASAETQHPEKSGSGRVLLGKTR